MHANLVLTGFMGAGKTAVGRALAGALHRPFVDIDARIEQRAGRSITDLFQERGEAAFRQLESETIADVARQHGQVIATGGGALLHPANVRALAATGRLIGLQAELATIQARVAGSAHRPLARDPQALAALAHARQAAYAQVLWQVPTDHRPVADIVESILTELPQGLAVGGHVERREVIWVELGDRRYPVRFGPLADFAGALKTVESDHRLLLVVDANVAVHYGSTVVRGLEACGFQVEVLQVPAGEASKSIVGYERVLQAAVKAGLTRRSLIVALGGGVVGDLAGFAAATYLRGVRIVQVPTSLLAMVDSSVGGKVAVNLPEGKNLVGAFHQPSLVWIDPQLLATLELAELRSGWAEVVKVAAGLDPLFWRWLSDLDGIPAGEALQAAIGRAVALKAAVVVRDERETGWRMTLNLGHTLGHALEAAGDYQAWRHGECVAWGTLAAVRIAVAMGLAEPAWETELAALLQRFGLPVQVAAPLPADRFLSALQQDKKRGARLRFILPVSAGQVLMRDDVPDTVWREAAIRGGMRI